MFYGVICRSTPSKNNVSRFWVIKKLIVLCFIFSKALLSYLFLNYFTVYNLYAARNKKFFPERLIMI